MVYAGCSPEVTEVGWFTAVGAAQLTVIAGHEPLLPVAFNGGEPYYDHPSPE
jgi:hypothetical protein